MSKPWFKVDPTKKLYTILNSSKITYDTFIGLENADILKIVNG